MGVLTLFLAHGALSLAGVSCSADAVSAKDLLAQLSLQSGLKLTCSKEIEPEPLIVDFKERPLEEVLPRLADVLDAEWHTEKGEQRLERSVELKTKLAKEERQKIYERLDEMLKSFSKTSESAPQLTPKEADIYMDRHRFPGMKADALSFEVNRVSRSNPISRACFRMLSEIGAKNLTAIATSEQVVYSDLPTQIQKPLPKEALEILADLRKDLKLLEDAKARIKPRKAPVMNIGGMPEVGPGKLADGYGKTLLRVRRTSALTYTFSLTMVGKNGLRLLNGSGYLPDAGSWLTVALGHKGAALDVPDKVTRFADLSRSVGMAFAGAFMAERADGKKVTGMYGLTHFEKEGVDPLAGFREMLIDPVTNDPLGLGVGPLIRQSAEGRSLIAVVGDGTLNVVGRRIASGEVKTQRDVRELLELSEVSPDARVPFVVYDNSDPNWTLVKPYLPVGTRASRLDRLALRDLIAGLRKSGTVTLDDAAAYCRRTGRAPAFQSLDWLYLTNVDLSFDQTMAAYIFTPALPFLASLKPGQWNKAQTGLSYVELLPEQKKMVDRWVYGSFDYDKFIPGRGPFMPFGRSFPLDVEPTELFPRGVPARAQLVIETSETPVAVAKSTKGLTYVMDAASFGLFESLQEDADQYPEAAKRVLGSYRMGSRVGYELNVRLTEKIEPSYGIREVRPSSAAGDRDSLPAAFLREANLARDAYNRQRMERKGGS